MVEIIDVRRHTIRHFTVFAELPVANTAQARKRARQVERRRTRNQALRSRMRTAVKQVEKAIAAGDAGAAQTALKAAVPQIDGLVTKKIIRKATAARYKHRLNKRITALANQ